MHASICYTRAKISAFIQISHTLGIACIQPRARHRCAYRTAKTDRLNPHRLEPPCVVVVDAAASDTLGLMHRLNRWPVCSVLVLESCEGFIPNKYHMWCCTARQCNLLYTKEALEDLGYFMSGLEYIECVSRWDGGGGNSTAHNGGSASAGPISSGAVAVLDTATDENSAAVHMCLSGWWMAMVLALWLAVSASFFDVR